MTDREFIFNHILINWKFDFDDGLGTTPSNKIIFGICDHEEVRTFTITEFISEIKNLYGNWYCEEEGKNIGDYIREWFNEHKSEVISDINLRLGELNVVLGARSWQCVTKNGDPYFWKALVLEFKGKYGKRLIKSIYDEWFEEKVLEESEKIMNSSWS